MGTVKGRQQGKARDTGGQSKVESMAWDRVKTTMDIKEITRFGKGDGKITGLWKQAMVRMRAMFVWEIFQNLKEVAVVFLLQQRSRERTFGKGGDKLLEKIIVSKVMLRVQGMGQEMRDFLNGSLQVSEHEGVYRVCRGWQRFVKG